MKEVWIGDFRIKDEFARAILEPIASKQYETLDDGLHTIEYVRGIVTDALRMTGMPLWKCSVTLIRNTAGRYEYKFNLDVDTGG